MNKFVFLFLIFVSNSVIAQYQAELDTLRYEDRIHGSIDSMDYRSGDLPSTFAGGESIYSLEGMSTSRLLRHYTRRSFNNFTDYSSMKFSALPHLGFSYSFGGQASQFLHATYQHAFSDSILLNINYKRTVGAGVLRNSDFTTNDVSLQFQRRGNFYSTNLMGSYTSNDLGLSGGISSDSLLEIQGLEFAPINKTDARAINKLGHVNWYNYFDFSKSESSVGLLTNHEYRIRNREYTELGPFDNQYDTVIIDSLSTRDNYNVAMLRNGVGLFYSNNSLYLDGKVGYNYWEYRNLGVLQDSSEIILSSKASILKGNLTVNNDFKYYLAGRFNELKNVLSAKYKLSDKGKLVGGFLYSDEAPMIEQRNYFSNHVDIHLQDIQKQQVLRLNAGGDYSFNEGQYRVLVSADYTSISNLYEFDGNSWTPNQLNIAFTSISLRAKLNWGVFNLHPAIVYSSDAGGYLPKIQTYGRLYVKGKLFKAKKLEAMLGIDVAYISDFKTRTYVPFMDTYDWNQNSSQFGGSENLHAFISLGIQEFRFFFRYENIAYFWRDVRSTVVSNYPIAQQRMRIGLTWDFYN